MEEKLKALAEASLQRRFSANARSLYLELVWQFGKAGDCDELILGNKLLQEMSGIRSSHSFDSARSELINAGLIEHKKLHYRLIGKSLETNGKPSGNSAEKKACGLIVPKNTQEKKIIENKTATTTTAANARESSVEQTAYSAEVQHEWFSWTKESLKDGEALELMQLEKLYGTAKVVEAIHAAGCADTRGKLSINFVKKVLARIVNGGSVTKTARRNAAKVSVSKSVSKYDKEDSV